MTTRRRYYQDNNFLSPTASNMHILHLSCTSILGLGLVLHLLLCGLHDFRIANELGRQTPDRIRPRDRLQRFLVQLVVQRNGSWNFQGRDDVLRDVVQVLADCTNTVSVRADDNPLPSFQSRSDFALPKGKNTGNSVLQGLSIRNILGVQILVLCLVDRVVLARLVQNRRRNVEAASPNQHLLGAVLRDGLLLVQPCQTSVHTLVQSPAGDVGNPGLVDALQASPKRMDRTLQD
mmetsp:Transcript_85749/g.142759  ORF Transcript_85749/g.142759 Transcript_85749/m.142759 type:complete len:234 (-) Transcript_85749:203-904(-)